MPKTMLHVHCDDDHVIRLMKLLQRAQGVLGVDLDLGEPGHKKNGEPRKLKSGSKRMALLKVLADGKARSFDETREAVGDTVKGFHNTRYNAIRDQVIKAPRKGFLQIAARGQELLKEQG